MLIGKTLSDLSIRDYNLELSSESPVSVVALTSKKKLWSGGSSVLLTSTQGLRNSLRDIPFQAQVNAQVDPQWLLIVP